MKILLMNPPMRESELFTKSSKETASRTPPLGLGYLAAYLETKGYEVKIWDGFVEPFSLRNIVKIAENYDILGIHVLTSFSLRAYEFANFLKEKFPNKPLVLGGCHVSALPLEAMTKTKADFAVVGEGELTLTELCKFLDKTTKKKNKPKLDKIHGIYYRDSKGNIKSNAPRQLIPDINILPFPARHLFNWNLYKTSEARKSSTKPDMAILTSRGCPYQCSYCSKDVTGHKVRNFSLPKVIDEIKHLIKTYGIEELSIWDETFTLQRERVIEFCNLLKKENINLTWTCSSRVDRVDEELLKIMKKAGCNFIAYGIESGNNQILKNIGKGITKEVVYKAIIATKRAGIPIRGYFMVGHWGDTKETIMDTINFACSLPLDLATFTMMVPLPNTLDYSRASKQSNFRKEYWNYMMFPEFNFLDEPIYIPEGMSKKELISLHKKAYRMFYFRLHFLLKQLKSLNSLHGVKRLIAGAKTLIKV